MKKQFEQPVIEFNEFEAEDCITISGVVMGGDIGAPKAIKYSSIANIFEP